jgi:Tfp pilus assembly protein PilF
MKKDYAEAHHNLGCLLAQGGHPALAVPEFQTALLINPGYTEARHNLGKALFVTGRPQDGLEELRKASETQPPRAAYLQTYSVALMKSGDRDAAMRTAKRALAMAEADGNTTLAEQLRREISSLASPPPR